MIILVACAYAGNAFAERQVSTPVELGSLTN